MNYCPRCGEQVAIIIEGYPGKLRCLTCMWREGINNKEARPALPDGQRTLGVFNGTKDQDG